MVEILKEMVREVLLAMVKFSQEKQQKMKQEDLRQESKT